MTKLNLWLVVTHTALVAALLALSIAVSYQAASPRGADRRAEGEPVPQPPRQRDVCRVKMRQCNVEADCKGMEADSPGRLMVCLLWGDTDGPAAVFAAGEFVGFVRRGEDHIKDGYGEWFYLSLNEAQVRRLLTIIASGSHPLAFIKTDGKVCASLENAYLDVPQATPKFPADR